MKQSRDYYIHEGTVVELIMECSFPCLMGSSRVVALDAAAKSRGVQESRLVRICGGITTTTTRINSSSSSSLTFSCEIFLEFRAQLHFYHNSFGFFLGVGFCKSVAARGERQQLEIVNVVENLLDDLRERERELAGHE